MSHSRHSSDSWFLSWVNWLRLGSAELAGVACHLRRLRRAELHFLPRFCEGVIFVLRVFAKISRFQTRNLRKKPALVPKMARFRRDLPPLPKLGTLRDPGAFDPGGRGSRRAAVVRQFPRSGSAGASPSRRQVGAVPFAYSKAVFSHRAPRGHRVRNNRPSLWSL